MAVAPKRAPQITDINDPRLVKALAHPLRVRILQALEDREASPSELAEEFDCPLPNLSYHFRQLVLLGMLELKRTAPRRGAIEHYYRAKPGLAITDSAWDKIPTLVTSKVVASALQQLGEEAMAAAEGNGFKDGQVTRTTVELDERGWADVEKALARAEAEIAKALAASRARGHGAKPGTVALLMFSKPTSFPVSPARVMAAIRELNQAGEKPTLSAITRHMHPKTGGQPSRRQAPGAHVQSALDALEADGAIRQNGTYKRGAVYEPTS